MKPELRSARLLLRLHRRDDAERIAEYLSDFDVSGNLTRVPHPYSLADAERWLAFLSPEPAPGQTGFAIELPGEGYAGSIGFHSQSPHAVLGYWIGKPYWGRGIMTEAAGLALEWYFAASGAERVRSGVFHFNAASLAVQRKLAFVETGRSRVYCLARDAVLDHIDTEVTRSAFASHRAATAGTAP